MLNGCSQKFLVSKYFRSGFLVCRPVDAKCIKKMGTAILWRGARSDGAIGIRSDNFGNASSK